MTEAEHPLESYALDFGHLKRGTPVAVARPTTSDQLQALVRTAHRQGRMRLTPRAWASARAGSRSPTAASRWTCRC